MIHSAATYRRGEFGGIFGGLLQPHLSAARPIAEMPGWAPYDVVVRVPALAAGASQDAVAYLPIFPAVYLGHSIDTSDAAGVDYQIADSLDAGYSSAPAWSQSARADIALPAPLADERFTGRRANWPRVIPESTLRVRLRSRAAGPQSVYLVIYCAVPRAGAEMPDWLAAEAQAMGWARNDSPFSAAAVSSSVSPAGGGSSVGFTSVQATPFSFSGIGDNLIVSGSADRAIPIYSLDLYTVDLADFELRAGVLGGGAANRLLVPRKLQHSGPIVYSRLVGAAHFELRAGESLILNQTSAAAWVGRAEHD